MKDAALWVNVGGGHQRENGKGADDVHQGNQRPSAKDGPRQRPARIAHFFAHGRDKLQSSEGEGDLRPEVDRVPVPCGQHVLDGEVRRRAVPETNDRGNNGQHHQGNIRADAARILQPLADVQPHDVQHHGHQKHGQRDGQQKRPILRERGAASANDVGAH